MITWTIVSFMCFSQGYCMNLPDIPVVPKPGVHVTDAFQGNGCQFNAEHLMASDDQGLDATHRLNRDRWVVAYCVPKDNQGKTLAFPMEELKRRYNLIETPADTAAAK